MNHGVSIREITTIDYAQLASFLACFPGDERSESDWLSRFHYWWDENPAFDDNWKRGFVLLDGSTIVGFVGSFPTFFKAGTSILRAFNGTTWRVLENYRKWSIDLWSCNREESAKYISFNTTPTEDVIKMITRLKYSRIPWGADIISYLILNPVSFSTLLPRLLPKPAMIFLACVMKMAQSLRLYSKESVFTTEYISDDLSDIETLWDLISNQFTYTNVRDAASVDWYRKDKILKGVYCGTRLVAVAVYTKSLRGEAEVTSQTMVDFWWDQHEDTRAIVRSLISHDVRMNKKRTNVAVVRYPHFNQSLSQALKQTRLYVKRNTTTGYIRIPGSSKFDITPTNSYFSLLQGDFGT